MEHVSLARFANGRHFENEIPLLINRGREMSPISGNERNRRLKSLRLNMSMVGCFQRCLRRGASSLAVLLNSFSLDGDNWVALESYCTLGAILFPAFSVEL